MIYVQIQFQILLFTLNKYVNNTVIKAGVIDNTSAVWKLVCKLIPYKIPYTNPETIQAE